MNEQHDEQCQDEERYQQLVAERDALVAEVERLRADVEHLRGLAPLGS